jgi:hypothetical protein
MPGRDEVVFPAVQAVIRLSKEEVGLMSKDQSIEQVTDINFFVLSSEENGNETF